MNHKHKFEDGECIKAGCYAIKAPSRAQVVEWLAAFKRFNKQSAEAEYTDTDIAWSLLNEAAAIIRLLKYL